MKEKCPFYFNVYYSNLHKRWFIPRNGNGLSCHCGHIRLAPDEVRISTNNLDETVLQRVIGQLEHQIDNSAIRALLHSETGTTFTDQQIRNLRASMVIDGTGDTPAERLFTFLEESQILKFGTYLFVFADRDVVFLVSVIIICFLIIRWLWLLLS